MFKTSRLGLMYLFFVMIAFTPVSTIPTQNVMTSINVAERLTPEERVLTGHLAGKYSQPYPMMARIVKAAYSEGERLQLSPLTLLAIMEKESSFRTSVVNWYGAVGLMQVVARVHMKHMPHEAAVATLQQPETNIRVGASILSEYLVAKNGDMNLALRKYSGNATGYSQKVQRYHDALSEVARTARA